MSLSVAYPLVNGHRYSFASIEAIFNGIPYIGFSAINYKPSLKATMVYGSRPQALGRTRGKQEHTFDFEMYRLEFEIFKATLGIGGVGFGETPFDVVVQYAETLQPVTTDTIISARIEEVDLSNTDGTDPSKVKCTCSVMQILLNFMPIAIPSLPIGF
jgi:hypothetical protein